MEYLIPIEYLLRIISWQPYVIIPLQQENILGMISLEEGSVCIITLHHILNEENSVQREKQNIAICKYKEKMWGISIDYPTEIHTYTKKSLQTFDMCATTNSIVYSVLEKEERILPLIDIPKIFEMFIAQETDMKIFST